MVVLPPNLTMSPKEPPLLANADDPVLNSRFVLAMTLLTDCTLKSYVGMDLEVRYNRQCNR